MYWLFFIEHRLVNNEKKLTWLGRWSKLVRCGWSCTFMNSVVMIVVEFLQFWGPVLFKGHFSPEIFCQSSIESFNAALTLRMIGSSMDLLGFKIFNYFRKIRVSKLFTIDTMQYARWIKQINELKHYISDVLCVFALQWSTKSKPLVAIYDVADVTKTSNWWHCLEIYLPVAIWVCCRYWAALDSGLWNFHGIITAFTTYVHLE